jgi:hypothetical protein
MFQKGYLNHALTPLKVKGVANRVEEKWFKKCLQMLSIKFRTH